MKDNMIFDLGVAFEKHLVDLETLEDFHISLYDWGGAHNNMTPTYYADLKKDNPTLDGLMGKLDDCFVDRMSVNPARDLSSIFAKRVLAVLPTIDPHRVLKNDNVLLIIFDTGIGIFMPDGTPLGTLFSDDGDKLYADVYDTRLDDAMADEVDVFLKDGSVEKAIMAFAKDPITDGHLS